jgi:hypothetical protein
LPPSSVRHRDGPRTSSVGDNEGMSHAHAHTSARRPLAIALGLILGLMAGEIVFGIVAGSLALLADAGHMLTDAAALALALGAATVAHRPARGRWTFGFRRLEILGRPRERDDAGCRRRRDRLHGDPAPDRPAGRAGRDRARRRAHGHRRQPRGGRAPPPAEPRQPERPRRVPAHHHRPRGVRWDCRGRRDRARDRAGTGPTRSRAWSSPASSSGRLPRSCWTRRGSCSSSPRRSRARSPTPCSPFRTWRTSTTSMSGRSAAVFRRSRRTSSSTRAPTATRSGSSSRTCCATASTSLTSTLQVEHVPAQVAEGGLPLIRR